VMLDHDDMIMTMHRLGTNRGRMEQQAGPA